MDLENIAKVVFCLLSSVSVGGATIFGLSSWLGKVWANRLMEQEKAKYALELEDLKADLQRKSDFASQTLREKLALYKEAALPVIDLIVEAHFNTELDAERVEFEKKRLATIALLGMFAPQSVVWAQDAMIAYLHRCLEQKQQFKWEEFRVLGLHFVSEMRRDIGLQTDELVYPEPLRVAGRWAQDMLRVEMQILATTSDHRRRAGGWVRAKTLYRQDSYHFRSGKLVV
jgi:hypothetical protein